MWKTLIKYLNQDDLYTQALHSCHTMLDLDLEMFKISVETLRRSDGCETTIDFVATDKRINEFERDVRLKVLSHLAVSGNNGLTSGLALVSVVIDIERIGDYSKNIYSMAKAHPKRLFGGSVENEIADLEKAVDRLFTQTVTAFKANDAETARVVMNEYREDLANRCDTLVDSIISGKVADFATPGDAAAVALYVRYLKRIAAHSRNIMTSIVNPFHRIGYKEKKEDADS
jgi:phosphate transport system protein